MELAGSSVLLVFAQIGVGFAGFASIVAALFQSKPKEHVMEFDEVRFLVMLEFSLTVLIFALLPFAFSLVGMDEDQVWKVSCAMFSALLTFHVIGELYMIITQKFVAISDINWPIVIVSTFFNGAAALALGINSFGYHFAPEVGVYVASLLTLILLSAIHFSRLAWRVATSRRRK